MFQTRLNPPLAGLALSAVLGALSVGAHGAETWLLSSSYNSKCVAASESCSNWSHTRTYEAVTDSSKQLQLEAWASTGGNNDQYEAAQMYSWSGLGIRNKDRWGGGGDNGDLNEGSSPEHAMDNDQRQEFMLLEFAGNWALTDVGVGWMEEYSYDSHGNVVDGSGSSDTPEFDVYYWAGGDSGPTMAGSAIDPTASGWQLLAPPDTFMFRENDISVVEVQGDANNYTYSKYWLVGPSTCSTFNSSSPGCDTPDYYDAFKMSKIIGEQGPADPPDDPPGTPGVPEPATWLLLLAALPFMRRRLVPGNTSLA